MLEVNVKTIDVTVKRWKEVGTVQDQFKDNAGRKKSACTPERLGNASPDLAKFDHLMQFHECQGDIFDLY